MDDKDWLLLKTLKEKRNLSRTAEALYVSQPSLSYRIRNLEEEFQAKIFTRTPSGIEMTPEGLYLSDYAEKTLNKLEHVKDEVCEISSSISGILRLGVSSNYSNYVLPELLRDFANSHPGIKFNVKSAWSQRLFESLNTDEIQVAIVRNEFKGKKVLMDIDSFYLISNHPLDIEKLPFLPMITYKQDNELDKLIKEWWFERFNDPPMVELQTDRLETCKRMVENSFGYAIVPEICLEKSSKFQKKKIFFKNGEPVERYTWLMYKEETYSSLSSVRNFVDFISMRTLNMNQ